MHYSRDIICEYFSMNFGRSGNPCRVIHNENRFKVKRENYNFNKNETIVPCWKVQACSKLEKYGDQCRQRSVPEFSYIYTKVKKGRLKGTRLVRLLWSTFLFCPLLITLILFYNIQKNIQVWMLLMLMFLPWNISL